MDLLDDYVFFGQVFRWPPSEVDRLKWSWRKEIKAAMKDKLMELENNSKK